MPQTLLSLAALMLLSFLVVSNHRGSLEIRDRYVRAQIETAARGAAGDLMAHVAGFAFDRAGASVPVAALTPASAFGTPSRRFDDPRITAIDQFHDVLPFSVERLIPQRDGDPVPIELTATITVEYVTQVGAIVQPAPGPTHTKRVRILVTHPRLLAPIELSRLFSTDW
ncbi:MAG: hypothetical protein ACK41D_11970 [Rubricoccaceae bacterium]